MKKKHQPVADFLRDARVRAGLSQREVADFLGYSTSQYVSNWERGVKSPPADHLRTLAKLYKVSIDELYDVLVQERIAQVEQECRKLLYS